MAGLGILSSSMCAQDTVISSVLILITLGLDCFLIGICWSILCHILDGGFCGPLEFSLCAASSFLVLCPENSSYLVLLWLSALSLQHRESAGLCLGYCSLCHSLEILSGKFFGFTSLVSCFSEITFLCWLMSRVLETIVS